MKNNNSFALITGATSGIGLELAKLFAADAYNLVIVARNEEELSATATEFKNTAEVEVITIAQDLFEMDGADKVYKQIQDRGIVIDVLVNDAGQGVYGKFVETDIDRQVDIIHLNIVSLVKLTKYFLTEFVERGSGKILNLSSIASKSPGPWQAVYHGTKAFVQSFTEAIRAESKDTGVTITALLPGATDTDFFNKADMTESKAVQDKDALSDPKDVAKAGYEALMNGDDMVVAGFKNKMTVAMGAITPDSTLAEQTYKKQEPVGHQD